MRLCEAGQAVIFRYDGHVLRAVVTRNNLTPNKDFVEGIRSGSGGKAGRGGRPS